MPEIRAEQLSKQTSNIGRFKVEWFKKVDNSSFYENYLHHVFKEFHYEKEFFLFQLNLAIKIAETSFGIIKDLHSKIHDGIKCDIDKAIKGYKTMQKLSSNEKDKIKWDDGINEFTNILNKLRS